MSKIKYEKVPKDEVKTGMCSICRHKRRRLVYRRPTIMEYNNGFREDKTMRLYVCKSCAVLGAI